MRPTFLNFRSPKDLTPDFYCPKVTNNGSQLLEHSYLPPGVRFSFHGDYPKSKSQLRTISEHDHQSYSSNHNFVLPCSVTGGSSVFMSTADRFQTDLKNGFRVGPGSYEDQHSIDSMKKNSGAPKIMKLSVANQSYEQNKYMYIGNQLVLAKPHQVVQKRYTKLKNDQFLLRMKSTSNSNKTNSLFNRQDQQSTADSKINYSQDLKTVIINSHHQKNESADASVSVKSKRQSLSSARNGRVKINQKAIKRWISTTDQSQLLQAPIHIHNQGGSIFDNLVDKSVTSSISTSAKKKQNSKNNNKRSIEMFHVENDQYLDNQEIVQRPTTALNIVDEAQTNYSKMWEKERGISKVGLLNQSSSEYLDNSNIHYQNQYRKQQLSPYGKSSQIANYTPVLRKKSEQSHLSNKTFYQHSSQDQMSSIQAHYSRQIDMEQIYSKRIKDFQVSFIGIKKFQVVPFRQNIKKTFGIRPVNSEAVSW